MIDKRGLLPLAMMLRAILLILSGLLWSGLLYAPRSVAQLPEAQEISKAVPPTDAKARRGLLFEIRAGSNTVYLFGTIHVGIGAATPLDGVTRRALEASRRLYLETDLTDQAVIGKTFATWVRYSDGTTLEQKLSPELYNRVKFKTALYGLDDQQVASMKPWFVQMILGLAEAKRLGYDPRKGIEAYLTAYAQTQQKEIKGLERLGDTFAIFDRLPVEQQVAMLQETIDGIDAGIHANEIAKLVNAWKNGDRAQLEEASRGQLEAFSPTGHYLAQRLFSARNQTMAQRIADIARYGPPSFVGIGVLHLVGKDGVVELLRKHGLEVVER